MGRVAIITCMGSLRPLRTALESIGIARWWQRFWWHAPRHGLLGPGWARLARVRGQGQHPFPDNTVLYLAFYLEAFPRSPSLKRQAELAEMRHWHKHSHWSFKPMHYVYFVQLFSCSVGCSSVLKNWNPKITFPWTKIIFEVFPMFF